MSCPTGVPNSQSIGGLPSASGPSRDFNAPTEDKQQSSPEDSHFDRGEESPRKQASDSDSVPSPIAKTNSSDEKLSLEVATKEEPSHTQDSGSERQNSKLSNASRGQSIQKPRKPYTITKSREVWTKIEHARFLSALQMYDRDWKKIELYIGTKTVLQIRSHAQKHFGKVTKYKTGEYIPPPRPKKRAALPYPRSCPTTPVKTPGSTGGTSPEGEPDDLREAVAASSSGCGSLSDSGTGSKTGPLQKVRREALNRDVFRKRAIDTDAKTSEEYSAIHEMMKPQTSDSVSKRVGDASNSKVTSDAKTSRSLKKGMNENCCRVSHKVNSSELTDEESEVLNNLPGHEKIPGGNSLRSGPPISKTVDSTGERHGKIVSDDTGLFRKRICASSNDGAPSPKRQALEGFHTTNISRVSFEMGANGGHDANHGLRVANNSLLVLSDCVDMMSREGNTSNAAVQAKWQSSSLLISRTKVARARSSSRATSIDEIENGKDTRFLNTTNAKTSTQMNVRAILQPSPASHKERSGSPVEIRTQQRGDTRTDARTGSPPAESGDRNNDNLCGDPQRSSVGSGSASDDPMAGLTCSDRPSMSDNGIGSSYAGSGSGRSVDSSPPREAEEDPKSSNEGSGDDVIRQGTSSRGSSPADPNSSVSREVTPNGNSNAGGEERDRLENNEAKEKAEKVSSGKKQSQKNGVVGNDILRQKSLPNGRSVPMSKTIAHLINDLEELECPLEYKLGRQSRLCNDGHETVLRETERSRHDEPPNPEERIAKKEDIGKG